MSTKSKLKQGKLTFQSTLPREHRPQEGDVDTDYEQHQKCLTESATTATVDVPIAVSAEVHRTQCGRSEINASQGLRRPCRL